MIRKINRVINEGFARLAEKDLQLRTVGLIQLSRVCRNSSLPQIQAFGEGILDEIPDGLAIGRMTPFFYRKYADCFFPSIWTARDILAVFSTSLDEDWTTAEFLERAGNH